MMKSTTTHAPIFARSHLKLSAHIAALLCGLVYPGAAFAQDSSSAARPAQVSGARAAYAETLSTPITSPAADKDAKLVETAPKPVEKMTAEQAGPSLKVSGVKFAGNTAFDQKTLEGVVAADLSARLTFAQLQALARKVEDFYHDKGYMLAKVIIPKQDIRDGAPLELRVLEGWLGKVNISGGERFCTDIIEDTVYWYAPAGAPFTISQIERPLVMLNSRSGINVSSTLAPGAATGSTDLEIAVKQEPRITGSVEFNNFGSEDSGEYRVVPALSMPNITGVGDELSVFGVISADEIDTWSWQASYSRPVGIWGTSINAYGGMGNNAVGNEFAILDIKGKSYSWGVGVSHKLVFSARTSLDFQAWFEWQDTEQKMLGFRTIDDGIRKVRIGTNFDHTDAYGRTFVSLHLHQGLGEVLGAMDNDDYLSSRSYARADNRFTKFVFGVTRIQSICDRLFALINFTGQYSLDPLVAGEQIYGGGATTVRGQPYSHCSGDDGFFVNAELRFAGLPDTSRLQLAAFFDHGQMHIQEPIVGQKKWTSLSGAGAGLRAEVVKGLDLRFDVAVPVGARRGDSYYLYGQARFSF